MSDGQGEGWIFCKLSFLLASTLFYILVTRLNNMETYEFRENPEIAPSMDL